MSPVPHFLHILTDTVALFPHFARDGTVGCRESRTIGPDKPPLILRGKIRHCERDNYASLTNSFSLMWKPRVHRARDTIVRTVVSFGRTGEVRGYKERRQER